MDGNFILLGHAINGKNIIAGRILAKNSKLQKTLDIDAEKEKKTLELNALYLSLVEKLFFYMKAQ